AASGVEISRATMSARGIMMSPTVSCWNASAWSTRSLRSSSASTSGRGLRPRPSALSTCSNGAVFSSSGRGSAPWWLRRSVGVADAQRRQDGALLGLHDLGVRIGFMIVTQKVQDAMGGEMAKVIGEPLALLGGFAGADAVGEGDVAQRSARARSREREHVGGRVLLAMARVERRHLRIPGEQDRQVRAAAAFGLQRRRRSCAGQRGGLRLALAPGGFLDPHLDQERSFLATRPGFLAAPLAASAS